MCSSPAPGFAPRAPLPGSTGLALKPRPFYFTVGILIFFFFCVIRCMLVFVCFGGEGVLCDEVGGRSSVMRECSAYSVKSSLHFKPEHGFRGQQFWTCLPNSLMCIVAPVATQFLPNFCRLFRLAAMAPKRSLLARALQAPDAPVAALAPADPAWTQAQSRF